MTSWRALHPAVRRFRLWYGLGGVVLIVAIPVLVQFLPPSVADRIELVWFFMFPIVAWLAVLSVHWVSDASSRKAVTAAAVIASIVTVLWLATFVLLPGHADYTVKAKLTEGFNLSNRLRSVLYEACSKGYLRADWTPDDGSVDVVNPDAYQGEYTKRVELRVLADDLADVVIHYRGGIRDRGGLRIISPARVVVPEGATVVYRGACRRGVLHWQVSGSLAPEFLPKL